MTLYCVISFAISLLLYIFDQHLAFDYVAIVSEISMTILGCSIICIVSINVEQKRRRRISPYDLSAFDETEPYDKDPSLSCYALCATVPLWPCIVGRRSYRVIHPVAYLQLATPD